MDCQQTFRQTCDRAGSQLAIFADNVGTSIPGATDQLKTVLEKAAEFQGVVGTHGRLHIMYEASPPLYDNTADFVYTPFPQSQMYIMFSPSIIFQGEKRVNATTQLISAINAFSLLAHDRPAPCTTAHAPLPSPERSRPPLAPPPAWYPGKRYLSGPQVSDDALRVSERVFALFKPFDMTYIHKIYRTLFTRMHARIKASKNGNLQGSVVYERFTPPWIRKKIVFGEKGVTFGEAILPDIHRMRNNAGTRRLKLILAAFYEREVLARNILDDILPSFAARKREERMMKETANLRIHGQGELTKKASAAPAPSGSSAASPGLIPGIGTMAEGPRTSPQASVPNFVKIASAPSSAQAGAHANTTQNNGVFPHPSPAGGQASVVSQVANERNISRARFNSNANRITGVGQAEVPNGLHALPGTEGGKNAGRSTSQMMFDVGKQVAMVHVSHNAGAVPIVSQPNCTAAAEDVAMSNSTGGPSTAQAPMNMQVPMQMDVPMLQGQSHREGPTQPNGGIGAVASVCGNKVPRGINAMRDRIQPADAGGEGIDDDVRGTKRKSPPFNIAMDARKNPSRRQRSSSRDGSEEDGGPSERAIDVVLKDSRKGADVEDDLMQMDGVGQGQQTQPEHNGKTGRENRRKSEGTTALDEDAPSEEAREVAEGTEEERSRSIRDTDETENVTGR